MDRALRPGLLFHLVCHRLPYWGHYFFIFVSDLPHVVMPGNTIALYADDCKTRVVACPSDNKIFNLTWVTYVFEVSEI